MIEWSDGDKAIQSAVRDWIDKEVRPHLDELETGEIPPYDILRKFWADFGIDAMAREAVSKQLTKERAKADGTYVAKDRPADDRPANPMHDMISMVAVVVAEWTRVSLGSIASAGVSLGLGAATIAQKGTLEQKERWLERIATLDDIACWSITEPDAGSDAFGGMKTTARRDGDSFVLNGSKTFSTNGPFADVAVV